MASELIVQKFGGTSVGTPERIRAVADRIAETRAAGNDLVVVVSAMGHTTDELIELARKVSEQPHQREMDMLLTAGERISMALLSMALWDRRVPAVSFTGSQSGIITDQSHRRARIRRILGDRVRQAVGEGRVAIVAGFQGVSETKEVTTLGRGGSDTTAVALAAALGARSCDIYTDVNGVYSADPRVVANARFWRRIPHDHMVEMANRGAGVLHPRSVELAKRFGVRLWVKNSMNREEGTEVIPMAEAKGMEEFRVTGVTADDGKVLVTVELERPTVLGTVWNCAATHHLSILAPIFADGRVRFFTDEDSASEWSRNLSALCRDGFVRKFEVNPEIVPLSVVGDRFAQDGAALHEVIETLAQSHVPVHLGSASPLAITIGISRNQAADGVKALHEAFFSANQG